MTHISIVLVNMWKTEFCYRSLCFKLFKFTVYNGLCNYNTCDFH